MYSNLSLIDDATTDSFFSILGHLYFKLIINLLKNWFVTSFFIRILKFKQIEGYFKAIPLICDIHFDY